MTELECQSNQTPAIKSQKTELNQTIEELENALRDKEEVCVCVCVILGKGGLPVNARATTASLRIALPHIWCVYASGNGKVERGIGKHEWPDGAERHSNPETWGVH